MAKKDRNFWTLLPLTPRLIRNLCHETGVHVYSEDGNTFLVNESYLMIHTLSDKPFTVTLPGERLVTECIGGKDFGRTLKICDQLPNGTTAIYRLKK